MLGLTDEDEQVRWAVYNQTIFKFDQEKVIAAIKQTLQDHPDRNTSQLLMYLEQCVRIKNFKQLVPTLIARYKIAKADEQTSILNFFFTLGPDAKAALPLINEAVKSKDKQIRKTANEAIRKIEHQAPLPAEGNASDKADSVGNTLTLHINAAGKPAIEGIPLSGDDLKKLLEQSITNMGERGLNVVLVADEKAPGDAVMKIIRTCSAAGATSVSLGKTKVTTNGNNSGAVYDGKTFNEWLQVLKNERKADRLAEAFTAMKVLYQPGRDQEVATAMIQAMRQFERVKINPSQSQPGWRGV